MTQPADIQQRRIALDPTRSFAVSAPAGSGKTGLLVQRVLTLLATCDQPEEVLAITFTRKAAAEMRQRIVRALRSATRQPTPDNDYQRQTWELARAVLQRDRARNWQLLSAPNRLQIQTIDSLCRQLARQLVLENGLGELPQPTEHTEPYYREAVQLFLKRLESGGAVGDALATVLLHLDNNLPRVEQLLVSLLARREQWLGPIISARDARSWLEGHLQQVIAETLATAANKLKPVAADLVSLLDFAASNLSTSNSDHPLCQLQGITELPAADYDQCHPWQVLLELLLTRENQWRKSIDVRSGFPAGKGAEKARKQLWRETLSHCREIPGLLETLQDIRYLPYARYPDQQWRVLQALTTLLPQLSAELSLLFIRDNQCDFTEITFAALRALGDADNPTDIALRLDYRIHHILIDEFQDTSSIQFQLLKQLTTEWQPDDGRTLFIVGDGMQSLYGFRSANVGLFLEARRHPIGAIELTPLDLSVNFRSQQNLVNWVNQTFRSAFPAIDDISRGAVTYNHANAFKTALAGAAVTLDAFIDTDSRNAEAQQVVAHIRAAQQQYPDGSIAVLVRNRSHLRDILPALYREGLNWQALDIEPLADRMAVMDAHSLTRALLSFADRIAWLAILRAPWCGLNLHDLHALATTELPENPIAEGEHYPLLWLQLIHADKIDGISNEGQQVLKRVTATLNSGLNQKGRKPLRSWIEGIWIALGGPAALIDANDLQHVRSYFDLLEQHAHGGMIEEWQAFNLAVNRLYATPPVHSHAQLQLMTIHKSKGLEFDTVIIPGLDKTTRGNDTAMLLWRERINQYGEPQLLLGPLHASGSDKDTLFEHLKYEAKQKSRLENTRVIYVGATRASKRLHLLFHLKTDPKNHYRAPAADSLLTPLWDAILPQLLAPCEHCRLHLPDAQAPLDEAPPTLSHSLRLPPHWQAPVLTWQTPLARHQERTPGASEPAAQQDQPDVRHFGTVLHRTLEQIVREGIANWDEARIERQHPVWRAQLRQLGVEGVDTTLDTLSHTIRQLNADPTGRWLLDNRHPQSACELQLGFVTDSGGGSYKKAIVDRTFIDKEVRWIIDYKSAQPSAGQTLAAFLNEQRTRYLPQLRRYAELMAQLETRPVRTALYFPLLPHFEEITEQ